IKVKQKYSNKRYGNAFSFDGHPNLFLCAFCIDNLLHCNTSPFMKQKITFYRVKGNLFVIACVLNSYNFAIKSITVH
ncbi:hypothetical protein QP572_14850, partial [Brevibacterium sp. UMB10442]|nr:hypothetical protein [Brevibacterium sp. UMB10442]